MGLVVLLLFFDKDSWSYPCERDNHGWCAIKQRNQTKPKIII